MIAIYRNNNGNLNLYKDAKIILEKLPNKKYLVTDGNIRVQKKKGNNFKISKYFKKTFFTRKFGIKKRKPNLFVFKKILSLEQIHFKDLVYVGDNPNKDFITLNKVGATTIRILRGNYKNLKKNKILMQK